MITILAVGKKHETWVREGIELYEKRLKPPFDLNWELLPHSSLEGDAARHEESERILNRITPDSFVILLDERGAQLSSEAFSAQLDKLLVHSRPIVIIIGGAFGVDTTIHDRADNVLSLSSLVLPHQLVRLVLTEQLYRAQSISRGSKYHHA